MTENADTKLDQFTSKSDQKTTDSSLLISTITNALQEKKAKDIVILDVRELTTLTDYFVICHGTSETQIRALANSVLEETKEKLGEHAWQREGMDARRWIIIDYVNVVVHIFNKEKREFYGIERMWNDAERTEIKDE